MSERTSRKISAAESTGEASSSVPSWLETEYRPV